MAVAHRGSWRVLPAGLMLASASWAAETATLRAGLPNLTRSLALGEQVRVNYFGGGLLAGSGASAGERSFRAGATAALRKAFAKASIAEGNAGIARTGSWLGAFRAQTDVVQHYIPLGLVVIEFASEDGAEPPERVTAALEGIVRQIRRAHPKAEILFAYALAPGDLETYAQGRIPAQVQAAEALAAHYALPSVHLGADAAARLAAGEATAADLSGQQGYPNDRGHALYGRAFADFVQSLPAPAATAGEAVTYALPPPLSPDALAEGMLASYEMSSFDPGWLDWQESPCERFFHVLHGTRGGATVVFRFRGTAMGLYDVWGPETADLEYAIDGGPWQRLAGGGQDTWRERASLLAEKLPADVEHRVVLRLPADPGPRSGRVAFFLVNGKPVWEDPYKGLTPLQRIDAIYKTMAPVTYAPPAERWTHLPRTLAKLRQGPALTIVMLGDSIVNDTSSSQYEHLLMRLYPACTIRKVTSVRGSTGCWWYKDENRVQEYVLRHEPDLLMIGGISQRDDIDAIRDVIRQVRAARPEVEVLLMTGAFGFTDPRKDPTWTYEVPATGTGYRTRLKALAAEETCEFIDMTGPWGRYLRDSAQAMGSFKRDRVHANDRGKQILGRILEAYFAPQGTP